MVPDSFIAGALKGTPCTFDDMHLHVGMRMQAQRAGDPAKAKFSTTLLGWLGGGYLIVKTPFANGLSVALGEAEPLLIRVFSGVHVHSFGTRVLRNFREPLLYLHLEFPTEIRALAFRSAPRVRVQIPAGLSRSGEAEGEVVITDLSSTGAQARSSEAVANPGDPVEVRFDLVSPVSGSHTVRLKALVRNRRDREDDGSIEYGLQFDAPAEELQLRIQNHVYERMLESRALLA